MNTTRTILTLLGFYSFFFIVVTLVRHWPFCKWSCFSPPDIQWSPSISTLYGWLWHSTIQKCTVWRTRSSLCRETSCSWLRVCEGTWFSWVPRGEDQSTSVLTSSTSRPWWLWMDILSVLHSVLLFYAVPLSFQMRFSLEFGIKCSDLSFFTSLLFVDVMIYFLMYVVGVERLLSF